MRWIKSKRKEKNSCAAMKRTKKCIAKDATVGDMDKRMWVAKYVLTQVASICERRKRTKKNCRDLVGL